MYSGFSIGRKPSFKILKPKACESCTKINVHVNSMGSSQWGEKQETEKKHLIVLKFRWHKWRQENNRGYLYFMLWVWRYTQVCSMPSQLSCTKTKEKGCVWRPAKLCGLKRSQQCNEPQIYICQVLTVNSALCRLLIAGTSVNLYLSNESQCA